MKTPHPFKDIIYAMVDRTPVQFRYKDCQGVWVDWIDWTVGRITPFNGDTHEWRIKPEPKSDAVGFYYANEKGSVCGRIVATGSPSEGNLKLTFDGETGNLKSAEVI